MHTRIRQVIESATNGKVAEFARLMGWSPQYVTNLLSSKGSVGIQPITAILEKFPKIDARWLLLGDGLMYKPDIIERTKNKLERLQMLEQYVSVMSMEELLQFNKGKVDFSEEQEMLWKKKLHNTCTSPT